MPSNYKIPTAYDIPEALHVHILRNGRRNHLDNIFHSKGVGEPPLILGSSVMFAIRDAIKAAR